MSIIKSIFSLLRFNNRNWKAVVLCIFAATVFWFFNALNKTYSTNIRFPLVIEYDANSYVPVKPLPEDVRVNVKGIGWNLFRRSLGIKVAALVIPLERPTEVKKIVGSTLAGVFTNQLEGLEINFVLTDTLNIDIQPRARRWVKVTLPDVDSYLDGSSGLTSGVSIIPDSVFVEGSMAAVTSLKEPLSLSLVDMGIDADYRRDVEVTLPGEKHIRFDPSTVAVSFDVSKLVVHHDSVKLQLIHAPTGARPLLALKYVSCKLGIPEGVSYSRDSLEAVIDLAGFVKGVRRVAPLIKGLPRYARVISLDTVQIRL